MPEPEGRWLDHVLARNEAFRAGIDPDRLPVGRTPGRFALVTCMDPRINPDALGIAPFGPDGSSASSVRVIRTIGGMADDRSLIVATHLAGIREIAFGAHTDCGNSVAKAKIETMSRISETTLTRRPIGASSRKSASRLRTPWFPT